jgi:hypothetical protein
VLPMIQKAGFDVVICIAIITVFPQTVTWLPDAVMNK